MVHLDNEVGVGKLEVDEVVQVDLCLLYIKHLQQMLEHIH